MHNVPEGSSPVKPPTFREQLARYHVSRLERLQELTDPYELARQIERFQRDSSRVGGVQFAMTFYGRFIGLAAEWPRCDQDALVHVAKKIFRVTVPCMRSDLKAARMGIALDGGR